MRRLLCTLGRHHWERSSNGWEVCTYRWCRGRTVRKVIPLGKGD